MSHNQTQLRIVSERATQESDLVICPLHINTLAMEVCLCVPFSLWPRITETFERNGASRGIREMTLRTIIWLLEPSSGRHRIIKSKLERNDDHHYHHHDQQCKCARSSQSRSNEQKSTIEFGNLSSANNCDSDQLAFQRLTGNRV